MLVIFSGTYGVGKTHFMSYLSKRYSFKIIPTYTTRELRRNETEKIHISKGEFEKLKSENKFLYLKEHFGEYYGIKRNDMEFAYLESIIWMIDFPIEKIMEIKEYRYKLIVILPIDERQIIENLTKENRIDRINSATTDFSINYADLSDKFVDNNTLIVKNYFDKFLENINLILQFLKH
jgi:guanylate kinase